MGNDSRRPWTHVVYVNASLVETKILEISRRRQIPVVAVQWIFDSYKANARLPTDSYVVESATSPSAAAAPEAPTCFFDAAVLAGHRVLISPSALGSDGRLPQMAEELGAEAQTWRNAEELVQLLRKAVELGQDSAARTGEAETNGDADAGAAVAGRHHVVVVLEKEDLDGPSGEPIRSCMETSRGTFVQPLWLSESYTQRRRMPPQEFGVLLTSEAAESQVEASPQPAGKRPRVDGATYAWQSDASTKLYELAEESRAKEMQSKAQQKVNEGLRLAESRREPSRLAG